MKMLILWISFWCLLACESRSVDSFDNIVKYVYPGKYMTGDKPGHAMTTTAMPPADQAAKVARFIMHKSDWCSIASLSTINGIEGYPYANTYSVADGPVDQSTGIPYLYLTKLEMTSKDIEKDNRVSISISMAQNDYCKTKSYDPEDPRCVHVTLAGKLVRVTDEEEIEFAKSSLFSRHPIMETWPKGHEFYAAKIILDKIVVMDAFGGPKFVTPKEYYAVPLEKIL